MNKRLTSALLWVLAFILMGSAAVYQRLTGPTHPLRGKTEIDGIVYKFKLLRSQGGQSDATIAVRIPDTAVQGMLKYKKFKTGDEWIGVDFQRNGDELIAFLPNQPPAGKLEYMVTLLKDGQSYPLCEKPVVIRFKGDVPAYVLIPHVFFMFFAMLFSMRTGMEALRKGKKTYQLALITLILLGLGGLILGPVVQKFAFGEFWTGWPFGQDLTDNKTLAAFVFWLIAVLRLRKDRGNRFWPILASVILLMVYLIPHSMFGSELDYTTGEVKTGR
jgi:uncharacterized membrane protein